MARWRSITCGVMESAGSWSPALDAIHVPPIGEKGSGPTYPTSVDAKRGAATLEDGLQQRARGDAVAGPGGGARQRVVGLAVAAVHDGCRGDGAAGAGEAVLQ